MDMGQFLAAANSLKVAGDIAVGLINLKTTTEVQAKAIELNQKIISAQHEIFAANAAQTALVERIRELEGEIARMKHWDAQKQRYQLATPFAGCMVYALKKAMSDGEPAHYLCTNCYQNGKPSILQNSYENNWTLFTCPGCKAKMATGWRGRIPSQYAEEIKTVG